MHICEKGRPDDMSHLYLQELQDQHTKESAELRAYYEGVTKGNLDSIQQLRKELAEMTKKEAAASHALAQVTAENRSLHEPLAQVLPHLLAGSLAGLAQHRIKRLLAFSSIGHVGYMLIAFCCGTTEGLQGLVVYITIYVSAEFIWQSPCTTSLYRQA